MEVTLIRASAEDAEQIHKMQIESFQELLDKYQDFDTNPGNETVHRVLQRLKQRFTYYYFICLGEQKVGAIRIVDRMEESSNKRISPVFVLPAFWGRGIAQEAIRLCEEIHGKEHWELDTILQEPRNCHLYEKMGYRKTGRTEKVNDKLTLTFYEK